MTYAEGIVLIYFAMLGVYLALLLVRYVMDAIERGKARKRTVVELQRFGTWLRNVEGMQRRVR
jgi:TM2 domain-containing membrane protein YozV